MRVRRIIAGATLSLGLICPSMTVASAQAAPAEVGLGVAQTAKKPPTLKQAANAHTPKAKELTKKQKARGEKKARAAWEAAKSKVDPAGTLRGLASPVDKYTFCNPINSRHFCSPHTGWKQWMEDGVNWSITHTDKEDRKPVPYPSSGTGQGYKWGFVYLITFRPTGFIGPIDPGKTIWKFGETAQDDWTTRAGVSFALCDVSSKRTCDVELVAVTDPRNGKYHARYVEASAVKLWNVRYGGGVKHRTTLFGYACPPGQRTSCR